MNFKKKSSSYQRKLRMNSAMNTLHLFTKNEPMIVTADSVYDSVASAL